MLGPVAQTTHLVSRLTAQLARLVLRPIGNLPGRVLGSAGGLFDPILSPACRFANTVPSSLQGLARRRSAGSPLLFVAGRVIVWVVVGRRIAVSVTPTLLVSGLPRSLPPTTHEQPAKAYPC